MNDKFKGLEWCDKHKKRFHWYYGCKECKATKVKGKKPLDAALEKIEKDMNEKRNSGN